MATANPLDDIFNSDVDPNAISALVGSLESQLASPTIKDSSQLNPTSAIARNHVQTPQIGSTLVNAKISQAPNASLDVKSVLQQSNNPISQHNTNGSNPNVSNQQLLTINNQVTGSQGNVTAGLLTSANAISQSPAMTNTIANPNTNFNPVQNALVNKQVNVSASATGAAVLMRTTQNGGIAPHNVQSTINSVTSHGASGDGTSAIYNLANVAAEQKPLSITTNSATGLVVTSTEQKPVVKPQQVINVVNNPGNSVQKPQFVIKNEPTVRPEIKVVSQPQTVIAQPTGVVHAGTTLKSTSPASSNVITITKPMSNPHTVTVMPRPAITSQVTSGQQIVVNVPNSANPRLQGISSQQRTLAPRMVQSQQVRIAPQQQAAAASAAAPTAAGQPRSQGNVGTITLPPGFQLPPGAMIVKNDQGQFMVVNPGSSSMATNTAGAQRGTATHVVRPGMSASTVQSAAVQRPTTSVTTVRHSLVTSQPTVRHVMQPAGIRPTTQVVRQQGTAAIRHTTGVVGQRPTVAATAAASPARAGGTHTNQSTLENVKKCKNFLSTLIKLAASQPQATVKNVKSLIQGLIDGKVEPEEFTNKLQIELKSSPQPYLVPFLKKSLPLLRQSMLANNMKIDGVRAPPLDVLSTVTTVSGGGRSAAQVAPQVSPKPGMSSQHAAGHGGRTLTPQQQQMMYQRGLVQQQQAKTLSSSPATPHNKGLLHRPGMAGTSLQGRLGATRSPMTSLHSESSHKEVKRKYDSSLKEDDDINDVATMGGVNLTEESKNILGSAGDLVSGALRTCKDTNFLHTGPLLARINSIVQKHGLDDCPQDVANLVSHATQERLRTVVEKLATIAEHRLEIYKMDKRYEQTNEVRSQLKFLEELDKLEKKRHEDAEREVLLRVARSRAKNEDPEQLKLKEKAKALQQAEMEQMRQREANQTALAAIGPRKKRRLDEGGSPGPGSASGASSSSASNTRSSMLRPRVKRVNLRDLIFLLEQERESNKSHSLYKSYLK